MYSTGIFFVPRKTENLEINSDQVDQYKNERVFENIFFTPCLPSSFQFSTKFNVFANQFFLLRDHSSCFADLVSSFLKQLP